jgi:hypothetical protein
MAAHTGELLTMDPTFSQAVAEWQTFYFALGTAAATLTGLLFVAVSLHLEQMVGQEHPELRAMAYKTLVGFVNLLFVSLYFLMPRLTPPMLAGALVLTTVIAATILGRRTPLEARQIARTWGWRRFVWRFVLPEIAQAGILVVAVLLFFGQTGSLALLVPLLILLLGTNVLNAWDLLVQVGEEKRETAAQRDEHPQFRRLEQQLREVTRRQRQITRQQDDAAAHGGTPPPRRRG